MAERRAIPVKILSYKSPQRYAVKRTLMAAMIELHKQYPHTDLEIAEIKEVEAMRRYTEVLILPSLVIGEKLVCVGRFPHKEEVVAWPREAVL